MCYAGGFTLLLLFYFIAKYAGGFTATPRLSDEMARFPLYPSICVVCCQAVAWQEMLQKTRNQLQQPLKYVAEKKLTPQPNKEPMGDAQ